MGWREEADRITEEDNKSQLDLEQANEEHDRAERDFHAELEDWLSSAAERLIAAGQPMRNVYSSFLEPVRGQLSIKQGLFRRTQAVAQRDPTVEGKVAAGWLLNPGEGRPFHARGASASYAGVHMGVDGDYLEWRFQFVPALLLGRTGEAQVVVSMWQTRSGAFGQDQGKSSGCGVPAFSELLNYVPTDVGMRPQERALVGKRALDLTRGEFARVGGIEVAEYLDSPTAAVEQDRITGYLYRSEELVRIHEPEGERKLRISRELSNQLKYWELGLRARLTGDARWGQ